MSQAAIYFRSGVSRVTDLRGFIDAAAPVGVVAGELTFAAALELADYVNAGGLAFVDSGAFSAYQRGEVLDFAEVLEIYQELVSRISPLARRGLSVVAPDVVGDGEASLELLARYADQVRGLVGSGIRVVVPLHLAAGDVAGDVARIQETLELEVLREISIGIPGNAAAMSLAQIRELAALRPADVHVLGMGPRNRRARQVLEVLAGVEVLSLDSNRLAAIIGRGRPAGRIVEERLGRGDDAAIAYDLVRRGMDPRGAMSLEFDETERMDGVDVEDPIAYFARLQELDQEARRRARAEIRRAAIASVEEASR